LNPAENEIVWLFSCANSTKEQKSVNELFEKIPMFSEEIIPSKPFILIKLILFKIII